jgi:MSHA biogenesis protein MshG
MPQFAYSARNRGGDLVRGVVDGTDSAAAASALSASGLIPLDLTATSAPVASAPATGKTSGKVNDVDLILFSRQMYTLLRAGVPIIRALSGLQDSASNAAFAAVVGELRDSLESGRELSAALARQGKVFGPFYVSMVRVGELTGQMDEIFLRLSDHLEFERYMREQVRSALLYPAIVMIVMALAIFIVNIFVIPQFAKIYKAFNAQLPPITQGLIAFSNFMVTYWWLVLLLIGAAAWGFALWTRTERGRYTWDRTKLRLPIAGKIVIKATLARFARSLSLALKSGVPVVQSLSAVAQVVDNDYIGKQIERMREGVERGESVLRTAGNSGVFTPVVLQMVAVGEESGSLDRVMDEIGDMYRREVEYELKTLSKQIEPILIIFIGVLVLILALGVFMPIWDLGRAALKR